MSHRVRKTLALALAVTAIGACENDAPVVVAKPIAAEPSVSASNTVTVFVDAAEKTGLNFSHFADISEQRYLPEIMGPGLAVLDIDSDGDLDVYAVQGAALAKSNSGDEDSSKVTQQGTSQLFENRLIPDGELRFRNISADAGLIHHGYGTGIAYGDYDNDGDPDLYASYVGSNKFYRNNGDNTFTDVTATTGTDDPRWTTSASFADLNNDGFLDLVATNYVAFSASLRKPCTTATGVHDYCSPSAYQPISDRVFINNGDGTFSDYAESSAFTDTFGPGLGVVVADFDGDSRPDIFVANDGAENQLWMNQENGTFVNRGLISGTALNMAGLPEASMGIAVGDTDNDGDIDLFLTHLTKETNTLYLNDGSANFNDSTIVSGLSTSSLPRTGFGADWLDYDNDGNLDLFVANGAVIMTAARDTDNNLPYDQPDQLYHNDGNGRFSDVSRSSGSALQDSLVSRGLAVGDLDNDGDDDVVVAITNGQTRLLLNEIGQQNHWLAVKLTGTTSNRDAIGAKVILHTQNDLTHHRLVHTDGSYLSARDLRVRFGLGDDSRSAKKLSVHWPSGAKEYWLDIEVDQQIELLEGSGEPIEAAEN